MTAKETAEAYVRGKLPELMELSRGCLLKMSDGDIYSQVKNTLDEKDCIVEVQHYNPGGFNGEDYDGDILTIFSPDWWIHKVFGDGYNEMPEYKIIGHPIQLQHWLRVLEPYGFKIVYGARDLIGFMPREGKRDVFFELSTGQPAIEADYQAFNDIVGV